MLGVLRVPQGAFLKSTFWDPRHDEGTTQPIAPWGALNDCVETKRRSAAVIFAAEQKMHL